MGGLDCCCGDEADVSSITTDESRRNLLLKNAGGGDSEIYESIFGKQITNNTTNGYAPCASKLGYVAYQGSDDDYEIFEVNPTIGSTRSMK